MVKKMLVASAAALALMTTGNPALAHHSANAEFDTQKEFTITGSLTKLENVNPHSWWYVDVKGADGKVTTWEIEMMSLNHLKSYGWTRKTVQEGDVITCTGGAAKSGAPAMLSSLIKLADGRMIKS